MDWLKIFQQHGSNASFHYADDTCREWGAAHREKNKALEIFDNNPKLQAEMREIAKGFLWSLER